MKMKKTILLAITLALAASSFAAPSALAAKKKAKPRVYKGTYACPCGVQVAGVGQGFRLGSGEGGIDVAVLPRERFLQLKLTDDSGQPVFFSVTQDVDGDGTLYEYEAGSGCGETNEPIELTPGAPIIVFLYSGTCDAGVAVATGGSFVATLSALP